MIQFNINHWKLVDNLFCVHQQKIEYFAGNDIWGKGENVFSDLNYSALWFSIMFKRELTQAIQNMTYGQSPAKGNIFSTWVCQCFRLILCPPTMGRSQYSTLCAHCPNLTCHLNGRPLSSGKTLPPTLPPHATTFYAHGLNS